MVLTWSIRNIVPRCRATFLNAVIARHPNSYPQILCKRRKEKVTGGSRYTDHRSTNSAGNPAHRSNFPKSSFCGLMGWWLSTCASRWARKLSRNARASAAVKRAWMFRVTMPSMRGANMGTIGVKYCIQRQRTSALINEYHTWKWMQNNIPRQPTSYANGLKSSWASSTPQGLNHMPGKDSYIGNRYSERGSPAGSAIERLKSKIP